MTAAPFNVPQRRFIALLVVGVLTGFTNLVNGAESMALVTVADTDLHIIRQVKLYRATAGTSLHDRDIVETGDGGAQVEIPPRTLLALAPHSRILVRLARDTSTACETLIWNLQGMVKLAHAAPGASGPACLQSARVRLMLASGSTIERANGGAVSVFAENGDLTAQYEAPTRKHESVEIPAEQFAEWLSGQSAKILARPDEEFLTAMPAAFHDALMPMTDRAAAASREPVALREVTYGDVASWLKETPASRLGLVRQFQPRLKDPQFRRELDAELGKTSEWAPILHPVAADASAAPASAAAPQ